MEYPKNREEFYELIDKKRKEISSFNISEDMKGKLYSVVEETIRRYEENEEIKIKMRYSAICIAKGLEEIAKNFEKITGYARKINEELPKIEGYVRRTISNKIIRENPEMIN